MEKTIKLPELTKAFDMQKKTIISILEGNALYRTMLTRMIASIDGYVLDAVFQDLERARTLLTKPTDVVIIDLEAGASEEIFSFIRTLSENTAISVIACSQQETDAFIRQAFVAGAGGYIVKNSTYDEFRANLMLALSGGMPMSRSIISRLIEVMRRDFTNPPAVYMSEPITVTCRLIEEVLSSPFSLRQENLSDFLSRQIGLSYHQLSLQFKKEMRINLSQYVIIRKIDRVKTMIQEDRHSLTQIANQMDYSSVAHLSAQFRKITGLSASEYKRSVCNYN
jgi:AraC-like DNA-binding protein